MWLLYAIAIVPIILWFILWIVGNKINWVEMVSGCVASLILAGIFHLATFEMMTSDREVLSGQITKATFHPRWIEEYQQAHTRSVYCGRDSKGNSRYRTETYYTTEHRTHTEYWDCDTDLGDSHNITTAFFEEIKKNFNNLTTERPYKHGFDGGDRNIYVSYNKTGYVYPVTTTKGFKNLLLCSKTVYSFPEVPKGVKVFEYPYPTDWLHSTRLINESRISAYEFDKLNTRLGFAKHINVIMINFGSNPDSNIANYQQSKYCGGKKNDLVICYAKDGGANWAKVFSWSESELCKRNLETLILNNPINNLLLEPIRKEIVLNYTPKDWSKFDYISLEPPASAMYWYLFVLVLLQAGIIAFAFMNEFDKEEKYSYRNLYQSKRRTNLWKELMLKYLRWKLNGACNFKPPLGWRKDIKPPRIHKRMIYHVKYGWYKFHENLNKKYGAEITTAWENGFKPRY
jgi:hypothetical protein